MTSHRNVPGTQPSTPWPRLWTAALVFGFTLLLVAVPLAAQTNPPGLAPLAPLASASAVLGAIQQRGGPHVDPTNRSDAANFYNEYYVVPEDLNLEWSGNYANCTAGNTGQRFRDAILRRINYFRAMAGVPADVTFSDEYNRKAQAAALMMSANRRLSHSPGQDWQCYSADGADAAGNSNLYLQVLSPDAIDGYMNDPGDGNSVVPHRRWLLFPQTMQMGTGDVPALGDNPAANALWVVDGGHFFDERPATRNGFVAWPPPGFVPEQLIFDRWSISYADADFGDAQLTMTLNGQPVAATVVSDGPGYGEATITWEPDLGAAASSFAAGSDNSFHVSVSNVRVDGEVRTFDYEITTFQPGPPSAATFTTRLFAPFVTN
jgi:uncharacterized protein YkwD